MIRVVLDANVIISGIIAPLGASAAILDAWQAEYIEVVTCPGLIGEVAEKLALPRIRDKYGLTDAEVRNIVVRLSQAACVVPGQVPVSPAPPDPDDTMVVSAAVEANARYVVTGDKGLLEFAPQSPCPIVSPRQFWEEALPRSLAVTLTYPVFVFEDLPGRRYYLAVVEGHDCLALFTSAQAVELYRQRNSLLAHDRPIADAAELATYLEQLPRSECQWVAFNPIGQYTIIQPIQLTIECLRAAVKP